MTSKRKPAKCAQCEVLVINGVPCHEHGCPDSHIDPTTGRGYVKDCKFCGRSFRMSYRHQESCGRRDCY